MNWLGSSTQVSVVLYAQDSSSSILYAQVSAVSWGMFFNTHTHTHTDTHRNTHTHTETQTHTDRNTDTQKHRHTHTHNHTPTHTHSHTFHTFTLITCSEQHISSTIQHLTFTQFITHHHVTSHNDHYTDTMQQIHFDSILYAIWYHVSDKNLLGA